MPAGFGAHSYERIPDRVRRFLYLAYVSEKYAYGDHLAGASGRRCLASFGVGLGPRRKVIQIEHLEADSAWGLDIAESHPN